MRRLLIRILVRAIVTLASLFLLVLFLPKIIIRTRFNIFQITAAIMQYAEFTEKEIEKYGSRYIRK